MKHQSKALVVWVLSMVLNAGAVFAGDSLLVWNGENHAGGVSWVGPQ